MTTPDTATGDRPGAAPSGGSAGDGAPGDGDGRGARATEGPGARSGSGSGSGARWRAVTVPGDDAVDPIAFAGDAGFLFSHPSGSLAGAGVAFRIALPPGASPRAAADVVAAALAEIACDDAVGEPGCGPVALAALPFSPGAARELVVPRVVVGRGADGTVWRTTVVPVDAPAAAPDGTTGLPPLQGAPAVAQHELPGAFSVTSTMAPEAWCDRVAAARALLQAGALRKVVLAREIEAETSGRISRRAVLERLRDAYPGCMLFAVDGFVGASPELLVARHGERVRSHPLAGTTKRSADPEEDRRLSDALRASAKDREEHRITIDMVHETLLPFCSYLDEEAEPSVVPMANVQHLGTMVEGQLSSPPPSALELALTLHPTPAVGGWPVADALAVIDELEGIDRGRYAGPVGWVDARGNGEWAVGIRSAELSEDGHRARLFAGVGVVADSDPELELAETRAKFQAMLSAIVRP